MQDSSEDNSDDEKEKNDLIIINQHIGEDGTIYAG